MVKTKIIDGKIQVKSNYSTIFKNKAKQIGGKWNYENSSWDFDISEKEELKNLLMNIYKEDGFTEPTRVSVYINLSGDKIFKWCAENSYLIIANLNLLDRMSSCSRVKLGKSVILSEGYFPETGGTKKYPIIGDVKDIIIKVKNMPLEWGLEVVEKYGEKYVKIEINEEEIEEKNKTLIKLEENLNDLIKESRTKKSVLLTKEDFEFLISKLK